MEFTVEMKTVDTLASSVFKHLGRSTLGTVLEAFWTFYFYRHGHSSDTANILHNFSLDRGTRSVVHKIEQLNVVCSGFMTFPGGLGGLGG